MMLLKEEILNYPKFFKKNGYCNLGELNKPEFQSSTIFKKIKEATIFLKNPLFSERIHCIFNDIVSSSECSHSECDNKVKYISYNKGYNQYCSSKCSANSKSTIEKRQKTCIKKYNSISYVNIEQRQKTNLERYGILQFTNKVKAKETRLYRYGDENYNNIQKAKQTKLERYGSKNYNNIQKAKQTKLERYGSENYNNIEKHKETCFNSYGFSSFSKTDSFKEKIKKNAITNYSRNNVAQKNISNRAYEVLQSKELFSEFIKDKSKALISYELCIDFNTTVKYITLYNVDHLIISGVSKYEDMIADFLKLKNIIVVRNNRTIIKPYEIDIYLPDHNLAIEFNGVYWHNPNRYDSKEEWFNYHQMKIDLCKEKGIQLLHIWEDYGNYEDLIEKAINGNIDNDLDKVLLEMKWT